MLMDTLKNNNPGKLHLHFLLGWKKKKFIDPNLRTAETNQRNEMYSLFYKSKKELGRNK